MKHHWCQTMKTGTKVAIIWNMMWIMNQACNYLQCKPKEHQLTPAESRPK